MLRGAAWFTKLDLRSAKNLTLIRKGDEWKMVFVTPLGHNGYLVMLYGLANASSVFQGFKNEHFCNYLSEFRIIYIENIFLLSL